MISASGPRWDEVLHSFSYKRRTSFHYTEHNIIHRTQYSIHCTVHVVIQIKPTIVNEQTHTRREKDRDTKRKIRNK